MTETLSAVKTGLLQGGVNPMDALGGTVITYRGGEDIVRVGERMENIFVIQQGWAIRYRRLEDGRRQILNFLLPGDIFDNSAILEVEADHAISAVTKLVARRINAQEFRQSTKSDPALGQVFGLATVQEEAILREQIVRIGRRSARERIAHLLLELNFRMGARTGEISDIVSLPFPQALLGDALGLSVVHISRTLSWLRTEGLIESSSNGLRILDRGRMATLANFDSAYLHLDTARLAATA